MKALRWYVGQPGVAPLRGPCQRPTTILARTAPMKLACSTFELRQATASSGLSGPYSSGWLLSRASDRVNRKASLSMPSCTRSRDAKPDHSSRIAQYWDAQDYLLHDFVPRLGSDLVTLLQPRSGERILDLGCGDGGLTVQLLAAGAEVSASSRDVAHSHTHISIECPSASEELCMLSAGRAWLPGARKAQS